MTVLSFESFCALNENILALDKDVRRLDAMKSKMTEKEVETAIKNILEKYSDSINVASGKFFKILKSYSGRGSANILHNTKSAKSILSKIFARNRDFTKLTDLIRGAILFDTQQELDKFVKDIRRKEGSKITNYEAKEKGGDATYGYYGSHHIEIDIDGFKCELQAMTKQLWKFKKPAHAIYTRNRDNSTISKEDIALSKRIFNKGNAPKSIKEDCDNEWEFVVGEDLELLF